MPRTPAIYHGNEHQVMVNDHPLRRIDFFEPGQPWNWTTEEGRLDLALSLLAHHFNDWRLTPQWLRVGDGSEIPLPVTLLYYRPFAEQVIRKFGKSWNYTTDDLVRWLAAYHEK